MKAIFVSLFLLIVCISLNAQIEWDDQLNIAPSSSGNNYPRIALDASGDPMVIWYHASRVMFSKWDGTSFTTPKIINPTSMTVAGASWMGPDMASHGDTVYVVFKETPEHTKHVWSMYSYDGGETFSEPVQLDFINDSLARFPTVTTNDEGHPIIAFMKFNNEFQEATWVVSTSTDFGRSFSGDVLASKWSSPDADVCDCCPGALVSSGDNTVMLYRDNNSNIRDTWAGFSRDGGNTFIAGTNVDQHNWLINACPSSGPDGIIIGDTLYSVFMNGAEGKTLVYLGKTSMSTYQSFPAELIVPVSGNVSLQNFPRIASDANAVAMVWKHVSNGREQVVMRFHENIAVGDSYVYDTVDIDHITNADVAMLDGKIYVVWEDYNSGTVKFRMGTYETSTSISPETAINKCKIKHDYKGQRWIVENTQAASTSYVLYDLYGRLVFSGEIDQEENISYAGLIPGYYYLHIQNDLEQQTEKVLRP